MARTMRDISRRKFLHAAAGSGASVLALPLVPQPVAAQTYPARPVHLIVSVSAGGSPDIIGRLMAQWLSDRLGQPFVVDNRAGAAGNIGTEYVLKAAPDGYTLLLALSANAINASLYKDLPYNFMRDAAPVASIATIPLIMEVNPEVPAKTIPEFIAFAKANPGKINMASGGVGSPLHVAGELFKMMAGVDLVHVPYRSEALALPDLLAGQVQLLFGVMPASLGYVRSGKLRPLGVTSPQRQDLLPDVPAVSEFLPGYEANGWYGMVAPTGTPNDVIATLNTTINAAVADPATRQRLVDLGCAVFAGSPADFAKFIAVETEKWEKVVKFANIKPL
jgi:tripartite-type tricarboxylate transporter receptor subunit TctC